MLEQDWISFLMGIHISVMTAVGNAVYFQNVSILSNHIVDLHRIAPTSNDIRLQSNIQIMITLSDRVYQAKTTIFHQNPTVIRPK